MSLARVSGFDVIMARIELPLLGAWGALIELDVGDQDAPSGAVAIEFDTDNQQSFEGTVVPYVGIGAPLPGRARLMLRAGANGMLTDVSGKPYENVAPRLIVEDIIEDAGEVLDSIAAIDEIETQTLWVRAAGTGAKALTRFLSQAKDSTGQAGLVWRHRPSGKIEIPRDTWPEYTGDALLESNPNEHGRATYALDAPDLLPGMTLDEKRVSRVVHTVRRDGTFRTEVTFQ